MLGRSCTSVLNSCSGVSDLQDGRDNRASISVSPNEDECLRVLVEDVLEVVSVWDNVDTIIQRHTMTIGDDVSATYSNGERNLISSISLISPRLCSQ